MSEASIGEALYPEEAQPEARPTDIIKEH